jgi:putative transposase
MMIFQAVGVRLKKFSLRGYLSTGHRSDVRLKRHMRGIWQCRFGEHVLRNEIDYIRHVDYIHYNTVKHGWVTRAMDWQYSSFHQFVKRGVYSAEWGAAVNLPYGFDQS